MEQTKQALVAILEIGIQVKESLADDGRINFRESMQISMKALNLIPLFKNIPKIKEELKARTPEEVCLLVETFKAKFDLKNDDAEDKVEQGIELLSQLVLILDGLKSAK